MRRLSKAAFVVALVASACGGAAAMAAPAATKPDNGIIVSADKQTRPLGDVVQDFAGAAPDEQVAFWSSWLCVRVEGLITPHASYLQKRIDDNLRAAGLRILSKPDCTANAEVVFPPDSDAYVQKLVKDRPGLYRDLDRKGFPPAGEVDRLLAPRAVRWLPIRRDLSVGGTSSDNDPHIVGIPDASHITVNTGAVKIGELVVVDYRRLNHVTWDQLADYISMVLMTDPRMGTDYSRDSTILALFTWPDDGSRAPPEMTDRDHLIVKGFGKMDQLAMPFMQRETIAQSVEKGEAKPATK